MTDEQMEHVRWLEARAVSAVTPVTRVEMVEILRCLYTEHGDSVGQETAEDFARRWGIWP